MAVELDPHQLDAVKKMHNGTVLKGGVGTGKSRTALAYYFKDCGGAVPINGRGEIRPMATPRDLYIITTAKKRDGLEWEQEAANFRLFPARSLNIDGVSLVVDSWNNIEKYSTVRGAFFILDEQRLVGKGPWVKAFLEIAKNNQWVVLSATPGDTWQDYIPIFIANGYYKNRTQFVARHIVFSRYSKFPKVEKYLDESHLLRLKQLVLVEMPYRTHTKRHDNIVTVSHDELRFHKVWEKRWHIFEERPLRDVAEMFLVARKLVNGDPSRLAAIMQLMESHPRLIIFYNFDYELQALRTLSTSTGWAVAEWNGHKHQEIPETDKWLYLVQYTAGAEGWNCITTDAIAFYSLNYSWKVMEQSKGRIDRMNTKFVDLYYYILRSNSRIDHLIWRALKLKKNFNERSYDDGSTWAQAA
jgi:hypothetical protein